MRTHRVPSILTMLGVLVCLVTVVVVDLVERLNGTGRMIELITHEDGVAVMDDQMLNGHDDRVAVEGRLLTGVGAPV